MDSTWLLEGIARIIPMILSLSVHEWAHAYSAFRLGDDTAARMGRMTLNPLSHIDPIGTVLLPLFGPAVGIYFGWAKPVPVIPTRFNRKFRMRTSMMITASAGPASNLVLAFLCILLMGVLMRFAPGMYLGAPAVGTLLKMGFQLNVSLAIFNLLPIPPLDGSRIADWLMPVRMRPLWERFSQYGILILMAIMFMPGMLIGRVMQWPILQVFRAADGLLRVIVGA
jgi:Zn-dependent protease